MGTILIAIPPRQAHCGNLLFLEKFGSPGEIRTSNPSVNSRTTNLIRTCRSWR